MPISPPPKPAAANDDPAASPCVGICRVDGRDVCVGCGRTIDEITQWARSDSARRVQINELAAERRRQRALLESSQALRR
nr:DUF1289 domain-containing protein [Panacagrimonas sp.]